MRTMESNSESKQEQLKKVENTDKVVKEVTKSVEKTEEKVKEDKEKPVQNPILPIFGSEINYII